MQNYLIKAPHVTVITVCKNAGEDLIATCQSVLNQTVVNIQFLIQDGVSTDKTLSYVSSIKDPRIDIISEPDSGIYDAMNRAFKHVRGKWCIYLNAGDCFYSNESLEQILAEAEADDNIELFAFSYYNAFDKTITVHPRIISRYFLYRNGISHQAQLWKTEVLHKYLPFDQSYQVLADQNLLLRAFCSGIKIKSSKIVGVSYKDMGFSSMLNVQPLKNYERQRIISSCFTSFERLLFGTFEIILLKSFRLRFNRTFRGTGLFRFYKTLANHINRIT
ncbi:MAG: glycosyltransferase [Nostocaceae cyanobacterium]|nr:glycosyltransferase [Nostocaceae cyanobacterium]